jgi:hypothetical protein
MVVILEPPNEFVCPITKKLMNDPVFSRYGHHYERTAILQWFEDGHNFCPVNGNPLRPSDLISNKTLQWKIKTWRKINAEERHAEFSSFTGANNICHCPPLSKSGLPPEFVCPLTQRMMIDPVITRDGISFERHAILTWIEENHSCPVSGNTLMPSNLASNTTLQLEIERWQRASDDYSKVGPAMEQPYMLSTRERVVAKMTLSGMLRSLPTMGGTVTIERSGRSGENLLAVLDEAINCSNS